VHRAQHAREHGAVADSGIEKRSAGGCGASVRSSSATRCAITHFSEQVFTNIRYFCRLS